MATLSTANLKASVKRAINKIKNKRADHSNTANGVFFITGTKAVVAADYDVAGDIVELFQLPADSYILGGSVVANGDYDTGGTAVRHDLIVTEGTAITTGVGGAFVLAGQPQNDSVQVLSSSASDTAIVATIYATTTGTNTLISGTATTNGTTPVDFVDNLGAAKTNWGFVVAVKLSAAAVGTITIQEKSGGVDAITLAPGITSVGVTTVTSTTYHNRLIEFVASGATTKVIGFKGTDAAGAVQYDSKAMAGATVTYSNLPFATVTEIYTGDLEVTRTATVIPGSQLLVSDSAVFSTTPTTPLNFTGGSAFGCEFGADLSEGTVGLRIKTAPTTANTGTVTFTYKFLIYHGNTSSLV